MQTYTVKATWASSPYGRLQNFTRVETVTAPTAHTAMIAAGYGPIEPDLADTVSGEGLALLDTLTSPSGAFTGWLAARDGKAVYFEVAPIG